MKKRTNKYWRQRSELRMASYQQDAETTIKLINEAYNRASTDITAETTKIFNKFAKDGNLTPSEARQLLSEPISRNEWNDIKSKIKTIEDPDIKRQMLNRLNAPAYSARITRLEALKENAYIQSKIIADAEIKLSRAGYVDTINEAYYKTMFDIQKGLGLGFSFATIPTQVVETILANPWSGQHFSKRIWGNTDVLATQLNKVITAGFMSGAGHRKIVQELMATMEVGKFAASRLVRTEMTYMSNAAEMESYKEADIDKYIFVATLDTRTSKPCQDQDRKVYKVMDAMPGKNMPPLHPFCRSTTRAFFGPDTLAGIQRRARDPVTGKTELVSADTNYEQWRNKNALKESASDGITPINNTAINKVPVGKVHGLSQAQSEYIHEQHKELLRFARDKNNSMESAFIFDSQLIKQSSEIGQSDRLDFTSKESLATLYSKRDLFVMHNHPKNKSYSLTDIMFFMNDNIKTLSIVKNNGNIEILTKTEAFNYQLALQSLARRRKKFVKQGIDSEYDKVVKSCLEEWNGGMVEWIKS